MIYSIVGTKKEIREKAQAEFAQLGAVTNYVYAESVASLEGYIDAADLFEGNVIVSCVQLMSSSASVKERVKELLPQIEVSKNIFIFDEPFADVHITNTLTKYSSKIFNGREEKVKDTSVFALCDYFVKRDKKQTWILFMEMRKTEEGEAIAGALWWKFQQVWQDVRAGKKTLFSEAECERIGGDLAKASIYAHRGEKDLMVELERILLTL